MSIDQRQGYFILTAKNIFLGNYLNHLEITKRDISSLELKSVIVPGTIITVPSLELIVIAIPGTVTYLFSLELVVRAIPGTVTQ